MWVLLGKMRLHVFAVACSIKLNPIGVVVLEIKKKTTYVIYSVHALSLDNSFNVHSDKSTEINREWDSA